LDIAFLAFPPGLSFVRDAIEMRSGGRAHNVRRCLSLACFCFAGRPARRRVRLVAMPRSLEKLPLVRDRQAELASRVRRWAVTEGRTDSPHPGLTFYRYERGNQCEKSVATGVMLAVVVQGQKQIDLRSQSLHAPPMSQIVFTQSTCFRTQTLAGTGDRPFLSLCLAFPAETIVKCLTALADAGVDPPRAAEPVVMSRLDPAIADSLVRLLDALDDRVERQLLVPLMVEECALRLLRSELAAAFRGALGSDGEVAKIQQAMQFMRQHRGRALSVSAVARHVGMSASHFAHRFRQLARVSPMRYLRQERLGQARALMLSEGARPSEAAARVGFASTAHFAREFKRLYGDSPAAYARRFRD
jgi:AraC-like DNA-binding protein